MDFQTIWNSLPTLFTGAWLTLKLTFLILLLGTTLSFPIALAKNSKRAVLNWLAHGYIGFFRGTPSLVQVFLLYYGAGQFGLIKSSFLWPVLREPFWCVVIALGLNSAAYVGKTLSASLKAVPTGSREAGHALGLNGFAQFCTVDLPLAIRIGLPAYGNEIILTCKATSLASTVTLIELTGSARLIASETYAPYEAFLGAGMIYLLINYTTMALLRWVEDRLRIPV